MENVPDRMAAIEVVSRQLFAGEVDELVEIRAVGFLAALLRARARREALGDRLDARPSAGQAREQHARARCAVVVSASARPSSVYWTASGRCCVKTPAGHPRSKATASRAAEWRETKRKRFRPRLPARSLAHL